MPAFATPETALRWLRERAPGEIRDGKVTLTINDIVENGTQVPIAVAVESPMTERDHVRAVHVVADGNPNPGVVSFAFTPAAGRCEVGFRIRLAQSQRITAIAELSDGSYWRASRSVTVTVGGCAA